MRLVGPVARRLRRWDPKVYKTANPKPAGMDKKTYREAKKAAKKAAKKKFRADKRSVARAAKRQAARAAAAGR